jgi:hypothetical protein
MPTILIKMVPLAAKAIKYVLPLLLASKALTKVEPGKGKSKLGAVCK